MPGREARQRQFLTRQKSLLLAALPRLLMREHHANAAAPEHYPTQIAWRTSDTALAHTLRADRQSVGHLFDAVDCDGGKLRVPQPGNPFRKNSLRRSEAIGARRRNDAPLRS